MKKLRLQVDELAVESFDPAPMMAGDGTVLGFNSYVTVGVDCNSACGACSTLQSAYNACGNTAYQFCTYGNASCGGSCDTACITCQSCDGTCPAVGCPTGSTCVSCADTCQVSCAQTCNCTADATCTCL